jgi:hypothetical protein
MQRREVEMVLFVSEARTGPLLASDPSHERCKAPSALLARRKVWASGRSIARAVPSIFGEPVTQRHLPVDVIFVPRSLESRRAGFRARQRELKVRVDAREVNGGARTVHTTLVDGGGFVGGSASSGLVLAPSRG